MGAQPPPVPDGPVKGRYPVPAEYGDRVRFVKSQLGPAPALEGEGVFELCWLGIEETWTVRLDDGSTASLHPCFGDTMEVI